MGEHLRYRHARDRADQLGQVLTPEAIADLLISTLPVPSNEVKHMIDLGAGQGALTKSALKRFPNINALLVEIDSQYAKDLTALMTKNVSVINADALSDICEGDIGADIVLSNPPYGMLPLTKSISDLLARTKLNVPVNGGWVRGDVAFVAKAWMCASRGSSLGLIIATPLVRDHSFRQLREILVNQMQGLCVTQLDSQVFIGAEVQAFLITGIRSVSRRRKIILRKASIDGVVLDEIEIGWKEAINRLDFDYYKAMSELGVSSLISQDTLSSIGATIVRGSRSHNDFDRLGIDAFHTTTFKKFSGELSLCSVNVNYKTAQSGDILIPRVGSRCLNNQAKVVSGKGFFTDSVYRISAAPNVRDRVWKTISSTFGSEWRLANASGSCAKHLTVQTLLSMPMIS